MIAVVVTARASWTKLAPVVQALGPDVHVFIAGAALLERYGNVAALIRAQCPNTTSLYTTLEGSTLLTSVQETALLASSLAGPLHDLAPSCVVCMADRHEVLGVAIAAAYQHIPLVHLQGGEVSGSIDQRVRYAISALADVHCVATPGAGRRVRALKAGTVYMTGCPSTDVAEAALHLPPVAELDGHGPAVNLARPFLVVLQHPVTSEADQAYQQMWTTLEAVQTLHLPAVVFWPGQDAGAEQASKAIRVFFNTHPALTLHLVRNLPPEQFLRLLTQAQCLIGNSSAGIRECSYLGVPCVNIGRRQQGRECAGNVIHAPHDTAAIVTQVANRLEWARRGTNLYGDGWVGPRIAQIIRQG